jgi:predicted metal-dependent hydrolase
MPFRIFRMRRKRRSRRAVRIRTKSHPSYLLYRTPALELALARAAHFNSFYNFTYKKISIRNQSSRWGSCSRRGNISFNYRIALLPPEVADYVVVHELCHLGEFNHSKNFWALVEKTIPNWKQLRRTMKEEGRRLF